MVARPIRDRDSLTEVNILIRPLLSYLTADCIEHILTLVLEHTR